MNRRIALVSMVAACALAGITSARAAELCVSRAAVCAGVEDREPVAPAVSFPADAGKVWFWTRIEGASAPVTVRHVWYRNGTKMAEVPLAVTWPSHRTWSSKTVTPGMAGRWTAEVLAPSGETLKKIEFTLTPAAE